MNHGVFICTVVALQGLHSASLFQTNFHSYSTARLNYLRSTARADQGRSYPRIWRLLIPWNLRLDFASVCTDESLFTSGYPERVFDLNHDFIISGVWCSFKSLNLADSGRWQLATCESFLITHFPSTHSHSLEEGLNLSCCPTLCSVDWKLIHYTTATVVHCVLTYTCVWYFNLL